MPSTENSIITVADYERIRNIVVNILGPGSGSQGYGQTVNSLTKSSNQIISQSDWDRLRFDLLNVRVHQTGAAFTATTNSSNSADRRKLQFSSASTSFLVLGMAVFGTGSGHPLTAPRFITAIQISGTNRIITLNEETNSEILSGTAINFGPGSVSDFNEGALVSASKINSYETLGNTSFNDRFLVANGQFVTEAGTSVSRSWNSQTTPRFWSQEISCEVTLTFSNANQARFFFNSGGEVRIASSRVAGRSDSQNNAWTNLLNTAAVQIFGGQAPSAGFTPMNGQNFYRLTSSYQTYYTISSSAPYAANTYQLQAKCDVSNNSSGTARIVTLRVRFIGGYVDPGPLGPPFTNDEIDGTFTVTASEKRALGKLLPIGDFVISRPAYSISSISGS